MFLSKKVFLSRVCLIGFAFVLLTGALFVSCSNPADDPIASVNAGQPNISTQPLSDTWDASSLSSFDLTIVATSPDGGSLSYRWYTSNSASNTGGTEIAGEKSKTLTLNKGDYIKNGAYYFYVVVTNSNNNANGNKTASVTSNVATVSVNGIGGVFLKHAQQPTISTQPLVGAWNVSSTITFNLTVAANVTDSGTLSYQWYSNTIASNSGGTIIGGETSAALQLDKASYTVDGSYYFYVVITNTIADNGDGGTKSTSVTSSFAAVTVSGNVIPIVNAQQPAISTQPSGGAWDVGSANTFNLPVLAVSPDGGTLSYQWYSNTIASNSGGTIIGGETSTALQLDKASYTANGSYYFYVVITNTIADNGDGGTKSSNVTSNFAAVTVSGNVVAGYIPIYSSADMSKIGVDVSYPLSGKYQLMNDITLTNWASTGDNVAPFTGVFNGNNKTITLNSFDMVAGSSKPYLGIFGYVKGASSSVKAEIKDLKVDSSVNATSTSTATGHAIGLVTGFAEDAIMDNITLSGTFEFYSTRTLYVGGIAGVISNVGTVVKNSNSSLDMDISPGTGGQVVSTSGVLAYDFVGGIVGVFQKGAGIVNCHNTGNVSGDNVKNTASGQVFVGGITGGSPYAFSADSHGYVHDCSYTVGTLIGRAKGFWSWVGGIAGCIAGGHASDKNITTRIERCFASGTVSVAGTSSGYPYVGGVVGYVYYGAMVSQCYFTGNVIATSGSQDYVGGIAGYSSYATGGDHATGKACVIEDCWSSGKVSGFHNAAGIVGQNQQNTFLRRCYSLAVVETTNNSAFGVGGITGLHASTAANAVANCVALNPSITAAAGNYVSRVTGITTVNGTKSNNYALQGLIPTTSGTYTERKGLTEPDGADIPAAYLSGIIPIQTFYETELGWDFTTVWKMGADGYPKLRWQN